MTVFKHVCRNGHDLDVVSVQTTLGGPILWDEVAIAKLAVDVAVRRIRFSSLMDPSPPPQLIRDHRRVQGPGSGDFVCNVCR